MSDQSAVSLQPRSSSPASQHLQNLTIPEAALQLGVSETRLRKTLTETNVETLVEFRQTRTGVRKTTLLPPDTLRNLEQHFRAAEMRYPGLFPDSPSVPQYNHQATEEENPVNRLSEDETPGRVRESAEEAAYLEQKMQQKNRPLEDALTAVESLPAVFSPGVPLAQFNALLFQHNVLREDLGRMQRYLDDCEHLLEEMIHTIVTLEARMQNLEQPRPAGRTGALSGALRSVSQGVQKAFLAKGRATASRPAAPPSEVYYANILSRS